MQRNYLIIGVIAIIVIVALYVYIAKPTVVLPTVTVPLAANDPMAALLQRQMKVNQLDLKLRTDGKMIINADGKEVGYTSYNLVSLNNALALAERTSLSPTARMALTVFPMLFQRLTWNVFLTSLTLYYGLPVEITIRFIPG